MMKYKLLVFLLLLVAVSFGQGKAPKLLARLNANMEWHKKKIKRVFIRKLASYEKDTLRKTYGDDVLKKLEFYPVYIRMHFPKWRKLDTGNIYNNLDKLKFSKRRGVHTAYVGLGNQLIGMVSTPMVPDRLFIDLHLWKVQEEFIKKDQQEFEEFRRSHAYIPVQLTAGWRGYYFVLDKDGNVLTSSRDVGTRYPEGFITLEEAHRESEWPFHFHDWRFFFKTKYQLH